jgi:hypothetical protein
MVERYLWRPTLQKTKDMGEKLCSIPVEIILKREFVKDFHLCLYVLLSKGLQRQYLAYKIAVAKMNIMYSLHLPPHFFIS